MPRTEKYFVGPRLLGQIRETIARVAGSPYQADGDEQPTRLQTIPPAAASGLKYVSWASDWPATTTATITFLSNTAYTATATNPLAGVKQGEGWVHKHQGNWSLVAVNLTTQQSYVATDIQMLGHDADGYLGWYSVTQCGTTAT